MSKLRCWPGCLARINKARLPENVGRIVKVVEIDLASSAIYNTPIWLVSTRSMRAMWDSGAIEPPKPSGFAPDAWLTPITPPPDAQDIDTRIERDEALTA